MAELSIALVVVVLLWLASAWAGRRFRAHPRLPMQWSLAGEVNWTAPRRIALAFTPALASLILAAVATSAVFGGAPRPGQEGFGAAVVLLIGLGLLALHAVHLWLIDRALR